MPIGTFSPELFARFRKAKGERRRGLLNELLLQNQPLVKTLVDELRGLGKAKGPQRTAAGGRDGFSDLPFEDALQGGLIALKKTMEQFDPTQGKLAPYLKTKCRHELQRLVYNGGRLVHIPRAAKKPEIPVALIGEQQELDLMCGGASDGFAEVEGITPEDVQRWQESGEWPESLEAWRREKAARAPVVYSIPAPTLTAMMRFLAQCVFATHARVTARDAYNAYQTECRLGGEFEMARPAFLREMTDRGRVREVRVRRPENPAVRALAGLKLMGCNSTKVPAVSESG
jgi:DNA-directed RNA polymerase specialized sigma subunit